MRKDDFSFSHLFRTPKQECIPVGCVPPACCPYLPACTAPGVYLPEGGCTCPGVYLPRGVYLPGGGGVPAQGEGGCTCPGVYLPRGVYLLGGVPAWGGVPARGGCTFPGAVPGQVLPTVNRMTDRCKNITLPQTSFVGGNNIFACRKSH